MSGFTGNKSNVRKGLAGLLIAFIAGAIRERRKGKAERDAKRITEGYPALRCAVCREQPCECEAEAS